jgi:hypothetical protein
MIVQHDFSGTKDSHCLHGQEIGISRAGSHQKNLTFHDWLVHVSHPAAGTSQRPCSDGLGVAANCKHDIIRLALWRSVDKTEESILRIEISDGIEFRLPTSKPDSPKWLVFAGSWSI